METDARISRLARNLSRVESEEQFVQLCEQIRELLEVSENRRYVMRSFNCLTVAFEGAFKFLAGVKWNQAVNEYAKLFGKIGNCVDVHTIKFFPWIFDLIEPGTSESRSTDIVGAVQDVFLQMVQYLSKKTLLVLLADIHDVMVKETFQSADTFKTLCSAFIKVIRRGTHCDTQVFQEFVDVVIGWMVDEEQCENKIYSFCAEILLKLESYFVFDASFTSHLLGQILDDLDESVLEVETTKDPKKLVRTSLLVKAFITIISVPCQLDKEYVIHSSARFMSCVVKLLSCMEITGEDGSSALSVKMLIIQHTLDYIAHTDLCDSPSSRLFLKHLLSRDEAVPNQYSSYPHLSHMSHGLCSWIHVIAQYPSLDQDCDEMLDMLIAAIEQELVFARDGDPSHMVGCIHALLRSRNVVILQKVYSWLVKLIKVSEYPLVISSDKRILYTVIIFLSDVASSKANSILTRWALDPPILEFLLIIFKSSEDRALQFTILNVLKAHCIAHSHFVSSVFTQSFSTESSSSSHNHLVTLTEFWITLLNDPEQPGSTLRPWLIDWIYVFVKTTSTYSSLLVEYFSPFFVSLLEFLVDRNQFHARLSKMLLLMVSDAGYSQTELYPSLRSACVKLVLESPSREARSIGINALKRLPELVLICHESMEVGDLPSKVEVNPDETCSYMDNNEISMDSASFDAFLVDLTIVAEDENDIEQVATDFRVLPDHGISDIQDAVNILVRNKLKSRLGKPPDLFGALQALLKKHISLKNLNCFPSWKLQFLFLLDREINIAMQESLLNRPTLHETVKNFYVTNRVPCTEWLKRLRLDVMEVAFRSGLTEYAYLLASLFCDDLKVKLAAFSLKDAETLYSMREFVLQHYVKGEFELASEKGQGDVNHSSDIRPAEYALKGVSDILENYASKALTEWPQEKTKLELLDMPAQTISNSLLDALSLCKKGRSGLNNLLLFEADQLSSKSSIFIVGNIEDILQPLCIKNLADWCEANGSILNTSLVEGIKMLEINTLLANRNSACVDILLKKQKITSPLPVGGAVDSSFNLQCLKAQAEVFFLQNSHEKAATIYSAMGALLEDLGKNTDISAFRVQFAHDYLKKIEESPLFYKTIGENETGGQPRIEKADFINTEFSRFLKFADDNAAMWYSYADFLFNLPEDQVAIPDFEAKHQAANCFVQYINLAFEKEEKKKYGLPLHEISNLPSNQQLVVSMIRLVELMKNGYLPEVQQVFVSNAWLNILPGLMEVEKMHPFLYKRFPQETSFLIASQQAIQKDVTRQSIKDRKSLFEPNSYGYHERLDDIETIRTSLVELATWNDSSIRVGLEVPYNEDKYLQLPPEIKLVFKELQRLGASREDQWVLAFQKLHVDWQKRISCLKDDIARDNSSDLFHSYIKPVWIFCEELLKSVQDPDSSPVDILFLTKYKTTIQKIIAQFRNSTTITQLMQAYTDLGRLISSFSSNMESKIAVSHLSPVLSRFDFVNSPCKITLPGIPPSIHIVRIEPHAQVLATKTKPKKVGFRGSDGKCYYYLIKGNENLNVDSCVMQFMKILECIVNWSARTYYVTPLGKKGGLIQLVPNTVPIFYLYKKYLQKKGIDERTTDMFWQRMNDAGQVDRSNINALQQVFEQLSSETSPDILSREIQLAAQTAKDWYRGVRTFTKDAAMASAIGYVLGVGDRHLDNILIDITNGFLIHVDFSLVFGKGIALRVPERVPFRLTQNISSALLYPGISGSFQVLLDHYIKTMKEYCDSIIYGVKHVAFAYDLPEELPIFPLPILGAELNSAVTILRSRQKKTLRPGSILKTDLLEMCKELVVTKAEISASEKRLEETSTAIDNFTAAIGFLAEMKTKADELGDLRTRCSVLVQKKIALDRLRKLEKFLNCQVKDYKDALENRKSITTETYKNINELESLRETTSAQMQSKCWYQLVTLFEEAIELADLAVAYSWVLNGLAFNVHSVTRVLDAIKEFWSSGGKTFPQLRSIHTPATAFSIWSELGRDVTRTQEQAVQLQSILKNIGETDISAELCTVELENASVDYSLEEYANGNEVAQSVLLNNIILELQRAVQSQVVPYEFVLKTVTLYHKAVKRPLPDFDPHVLESLTSIHLETRNALRTIIESSCEPLLDYGITIVLRIAKTIKMLFMINETGDEEMEKFSEENVQQRWKETILNLELVLHRFQQWLQGEDMVAFNSNGDILAQLLAPITGFTTPLVLKCKHLILASANNLLEKHENCRSMTVSDPIQILLTKSRAYEERSVYLKELKLGLEGTEAAVLFLSSEKQRFEFAFHNELNMNADYDGDKSHGFYSMVELLQLFSSKWLEVDEKNEYFNGKIALQNPELAPVIPSIYAYMSSVYKFVSAIVNFQACSRNTNILRQYVQMADLFKTFVEHTSHSFDQASEQYVALSCEGTFPDNLPITKDGNQSWLEWADKQVLSKLQSEVSSKKSVAELLSKSLKRDKLITSRIARIVNRWCRVLANLHPTLVFVYKYAKSTEAVKKFKKVMDEEWLSKVASYWFLKTEEEQLEDPSVIHAEFDSSEQTLKLLVETLYQGAPLEINCKAVGYFPQKPSQQPENYVSFSKEKIMTFGESTNVEKIIAEAVCKESLAQMYEGWSAWV